MTGGGDANAAPSGGGDNAALERMAEVSARMDAVTSQLEENLDKVTGANDRGQAGVPESPIALSTEQQAHISSLRRQDAAVRSRGQTHLAAAGGLTRADYSFTYETGPDGRRYATNSNVSINPSMMGTADDMIAAARRIRIAALGSVAGTHSDDHAIASTAAQMEMQARATQTTTGTQTNLEAAPPVVDTPRPERGGANTQTLSALYQVGASALNRTS